MSITFTKSFETSGGKIITESASIYTDEPHTVETAGAIIGELRRQISGELNELSPGDILQARI